MNERLRCYLVRFMVDEKERGWVPVIHKTEEDAKALVRDHFASQGVDVTLIRVKTISLVKGAYVIGLDAQP